MSSRAQVNLFSAKKFEGIISGRCPKMSNRLLCCAQHAMNNLEIGQAGANRNVTVHQYSTVHCTYSTVGVQCTHFSIFFSRSVLCRSVLFYISPQVNLSCVGLSFLCSVNVYLGLSVLCRFTYAYLSYVGISRSIYPVQI